MATPENASKTQTVNEILSANPTLRIPDMHLRSHQAARYFLRSKLGINMTLDETFILRIGGSLWRFTTESRGQDDGGTITVFSNGNVVYEPEKSRKKKGSDESN